ncbi:MAG: hypothetical protein V1663_05005 [archaeon]
MEIISIYNTPIILEEGDLIAIDKQTRRLYIREGDKFYVSCNRLDRFNLEDIIEVNSIGNYSRNKDSHPNLRWRRYKPR